MTIIWEVDVGYVGGSRPQTLEISDEEIEDCESTEEIEEYIDACVKNEFETTVSYSWKIDK